MSKEFGAKEMTPPTVPIKLFTEALMAEGLVEIDRPGSTCLNHALPLFTHPNVVLPQLYGEEIVQDSSDFSTARAFFDRAIKLPVWAFADEVGIVKKYIEGLVKVADLIATNPEVFRGVINYE